MNVHGKATRVPAPGSFLGALTNARFEIVPIQGAEEQARFLPRGTRVTVTCSPTRGIAHTLQIAGRLAREDLRVVPHISARLVVDESHLKDLLQQLAGFALREVFIVGGDVKKPVGTFSSSLDLLEAMSALGHDLDDIGVAAYPEGHPLVDEITLLRTLIAKQSFATYMVTQICFDPEKIVRWLHEMRHQEVDLPAYVGVPGLVDTKRLLRISMKIGVGDSIRFLVKHTNLVAGLLGRGGYHPDQVVDSLVPSFEVAEYNIHGLHINTFNQVESTVKWQQDLITGVDRS